MLKENKLDTYNSSDMSMYIQQDQSLKNKEKLNYEMKNKKKQLIDKCLFMDQYKDGAYKPFFDYQK